MVATDSYLIRAEIRKMMAVEMFLSLKISDHRMREMYHHKHKRQDIDTRRAIELIQTILIDILPITEAVILLHAT